MTGLVGKRTNQPRDVIGMQIRSEMQSMWGPIPGSIVSYDAATQTATVQPLYRPIHNGQPVDMPQLFEVPIDLPRTGSAGMTFPIPAGTKVMLTPMMRSMENYDANGDGAPVDRRMFSLSDMRATIAGGDSVSSPMEGVDPDNTHIRFNTSGSFGMRGSPDGKVAIEGSEGNIMDILAQVVELLGIETTSVNSGSSQGTWPLTHRAQFAELGAKLRAMTL